MLRIGWSVVYVAYHFLSGPIPFVIGYIAFKNGWNQLSKSGMFFFSTWLHRFKAWLQWPQTHSYSFSWQLFFFFLGKNTNISTIYLFWLLLRVNIRSKKLWRYNFTVSLILIFFANFKLMTAEFLFRPDLTTSILFWGPSAGQVFFRFRSFQNRKIMIRAIFFRRLISSPCN